TFVAMLPQADIRPSYSITSSARASSVGRDLEANRLCGLEVDHQIVLGRRLYRQIGRLLALEDPVDIASGAAEFRRSCGVVARPGVKHSSRIGPLRFITGRFPRTQYRASRGSP